MFQPPIFREERTDLMHSLMRHHPFAMIVSNATGSLAADHLPLVLHDGDTEFGVLRGHVAVGNPLFRGTEGSIRVLVVFQGPQSYVTPSWYPSKQIHGKVVPTWNYAVVHASGNLRFVRDADWLLDHLHDLTSQHEKKRERPWAVSDAPKDFLMRQLRGLVGFEIEISNLVGTWKVSQNKGAADREGVENGLLNDASAQESLVSKMVKDPAR